MRSFWTSLRAQIGFIFVACVWLVACVSPNPPNDVAVLHHCEEPRPQVCTRDYRPVCARSDSKPYETAGNACTACSSAEVAGYVEGECPPD